MSIIIGYQTCIQWKYIIYWVFTPWKFSVDLENTQEKEGNCLKNCFELIKTKKKTEFNVFVIEIMKIVYEIIMQIVIPCCAFSFSW